MALTYKRKNKNNKRCETMKKTPVLPMCRLLYYLKQIDKLVLHLKKHPQDVHSKKGLITMVIKRKKLLAYLKKISEKRYSAIIKKIGLKK